MSAVNSSRVTTIAFTGGVVGTQEIEAAENAASPGKIDIVTLASGFNQISVPSVSGVASTAVTIIPPAGNAQSLTLKGLTGDTGFRLHDTDPFTLSLHSTVTSFGITAGGSVVGVRLIWS